MASRRPSFLKRQKEQKRTARALEKRAARKEKKQAQGAERLDAPWPEAGREKTDDAGAPALDRDSGLGAVTA
jgi:hypothetical protein